MKFKKNKENIITFRARGEHVWEVRERPFPSSNALPDWWKEIKPYSNLENKFELNPDASLTVKKCAPLLDAFTAGYIVPLWTDVFVSKQNDLPFIRWGSQETVFEVWPEGQVSKYEIPDSCSPIVFKYLHGWTIKTPPGWSCLITHPFGYQNIPIKTISGIVDTDMLETGIDTPFFVKKDFEGIIKKGTPMFQIIPFKRNDWQSNFILENENQTYFNIEKLRTKLIGSYSRYFRVKKNYK